MTHTMSDRFRHGFIVFEGIDGSGKTTVSRRLADHLRRLGQPVTWLREPSDSPWGREIRRLARTRSHIPIEEELDYFQKDREWNVKENIRPALDRGERGVFDRYFCATACYQGARGLSVVEILEMNRRFAPEPDIVFLIDVAVDIGLERIGRDRRDRARLFETAAFLTRVRENYLKLSDDHIVHIDGNRSLNNVFAAVLTHLA